MYYVRELYQMSFALALFWIILVFGERSFGKSSFWRKVLNLSDKYSYCIYLTYMIYIKGDISLFGVTGIYVFDFLLVIFVTVLSAIVLHAICDVARKRSRKIRGEV